MMQKTLKKSKKENPEKVKSYIVTENGLGKFLKFTDIYFAYSTLMGSLKKFNNFEHFRKNVVEAIKEINGKRLVMTP